MRVVVTGIAPISKNGIGKDEFFQSLYAKEIKSQKIPDSVSSKSKWYVPYPDELFKNYKDLMGDAYSRAPKNAASAVAAANLSLQDAGISEVDKDAAVIMGVALPNMPEMTRTYQADASGKRFHPLTITHSIINAVSAWISIALGTHGINYVVSTACASGTTAVAHAYRMIRDGYVKTAIAGGTEYLADDHFITFRSFDAIDALSLTDDGTAKVFSKERSGFMFSEGASCVLVLEELETALARKADIYAEITDYYECSDGYHIVMMPDEPDSIRSAFDYVFSKHKVDYYNAHGTGTKLNDETECRLLKEMSEKYGNSPYINSTKGIIGHSLGASGAIEAAVCAYAIRNSAIHGNVLGTPIECICLPKETVHADIKCAVSASFGFGGHDAMLVFERFNPEKE